MSTRQKNIFFILSMTLSLVLILFLNSTAYCETEWRNVTSGIDGSEFNGISVAANNPEVAYAAVSGGVYKTKDGGISWARSLVLGRAEANFVIINPDNSKIVYAATDKGLYKTVNSGRDWERVFSGWGRKEIVRTIALDPADPNKIYIGTEGGLFKSADSGRRWQRAAGLLAGSRVYHIAVHPSDPRLIYAVSGKGLFKSKDGGSNWESIFSYIMAREDYDAAAGGATEEIETVLPRARAVAVSPGDPDKVYLATEDGIFESSDRGLTWHPFIDEGIISKKINFLAFSPLEPNDLYAATDRGIFQFSADENMWVDLCLDGGPGVKFVACDMDKNNSTWAAAENGLYKTAGEMDEAESSRLEFHKLLTYFDDEPSVGEIQKAAIKYAEVYPEKIASWRKAARSKALLPRLTFGIDQAESDTYEIYTSSSTQYYLTGPKDSTDGWDITVTWDLGDLIWNEYQTQIDVRSKLMVQLRDDILDEVNRYYFERRKLQIELLEAPPKDTAGRIRKELRLQELTANIDALTGGYLTDQLQ